jgi:hypothetical protein
MEPYKNLGHNSGVTHYEINDSSIKVKFKGNIQVYVYTSTKPGQQHVAKMKELALAGRGLQTYINKHKGAGFDRKERLL